jgi:hypothetical protein
MYWIKNSTHQNFHLLSEENLHKENQPCTSKKSNSKGSSMKPKEKDLFILQRNWWDKNEQSLDEFAKIKLIDLSHLV